MEDWGYLTVNTKGVFRTQLNIYDGAFLRKELTAFRSIVDVLLSSKHASASFIIDSNFGAMNNNK